MKKLPRGFTAPLDNNHLPVYDEPPDTRRQLCGRNSAVECQLPKLDVAGSTPVARSRLTAESRWNFLVSWPLRGRAKVPWVPVSGWTSLLIDSFVGGSKSTALFSEIRVGCG